MKNIDDEWALLRSPLIKLPACNSWREKYATIGARAEGMALQEMLRQLCRRLAQEQTSQKTQRIAQFLSLHADQRPFAEIAKEIGVHRATVYRSIKPRAMEALADELKYDTMRR